MQQSRSPDLPAPVHAFADASDRRWEVREIRDPVLPERRGLFIRPEFAAGWLLFNCGLERRRLAPLPPGWRHATPQQFQRWVEDALLVSSLPPA